MAESQGQELDTRYRQAALTVSGMLALTALLMASAYAGVRPNLPAGLRSPVNYGVIWVTILVFGLVAVA
ncbi:MAG: hypothetical protein ACRD9R_23095, partial [Pyrinomonadaceae bacterium]